jgi:CRISPR-associated exonuclease Cas4
VEIDPDDTLVPVEYKMGVPHGDAALIQLCAQALCLEEMTGRQVTVGALWFSGPRRRVSVPIDDDLRGRTVAAIVEVRSMFGAPHLPPAVDDERCLSCQLLGHCLPGAVAHPRRTLDHLEKEVFSSAS